MKTFSLTRRVLALVVSVSIASLILHALLLFNWIKPLGQELGVRIATQISSVASALRSTEPSRRAALANAFVAGGLKVSRQAPLRGVTQGDGPALPPPLLDELRAAAGAGVRVVPAQSGTGELVIHFGLPIDGDTWWISLPATHPSMASTLMPMIGTIALVGAAAAFALLLGVRLITRPMLRLADDMLARRSALTPIPEPASVSVELREVIRSFNQLVHALELSDESRRNLLAGVSHDLRTPLARLKLRAEVECTEAVCDRMEPDFAALARIIDQFLAYSQGQTAAALGGLQPLPALVAQVVNQYRESGHDVHATRDDAVDMALPDISVERALSNLIDNAIAYGKGAIEVELRAVDSGAQLTVFDHGAGIAEQDLEHALTPFVRVADKESSVGHCGLGLAIVAQIAAQLKGRVVHEPFDGVRSGVGLFVPTQPAS